MLKIPQLVEWAGLALGEDHRQLREAEQVAWKIRNLLELRYSVSAAILWLVSEAYRLDQWHTAEEDFESFELWLEFVFDGTNVKRGATIWTIAQSFATGLSPWLRSNNIADDNGEIITPERVLDEAGYSLLQDVNTAWWSKFKHDPEAEETQEVMQAVTQEIIKPGTTRESIDEWLVAEGHRKRVQAREYQFAEQGCTDGTAFVVMCPKGEDVDFVKKRLEKSLAMFPGRLQEVCPELVFVGEWGVEMIDEGMREQ
jgi:hypothetical protein